MNDEGDRRSLPVRAAGRRDALVRLVGPAIAFVVPLLQFSLTAQRDVQFWDVGEFQTVIHILGIAHPTGFPFYILSSYALTHVVPFGTPAFAASLCSSLAGACACFATYAIAHALTHSRLAGICASLFLARNATVWTVCTRADPHPLALATVLGSVFFALRYSHSRKGEYAVVSCTFFGLALATHPVAVWAAPCIVLVLLSNGVPTLRIGVASLIGVALPLLSYGAIPARSAYVFGKKLDPTLALGFGPGMPFWDYAHTADATRFVWYVSGQQFATKVGFAAYLPPRVFGLLSGFPVVLVKDGGIVTLALAFAGLCVAAATLRKPIVIALAALLLAGVPFALGYDEEADKERYLLQAFAAECIFASIAVAAVVRSSRNHRTALSLATGTVALGAIGYLAYAHRHVIDVNADAAARTFVTQIRADTPDRSIVVASWLFATPVAYGIYGDGTLGERIIVTGRPPAAQIATWLETRCVIVALDPGESRDFGTLTLRALEDKGLQTYAFVAPQGPEHCPAHAAP